MKEEKEKNSKEKEKKSERNSMYENILWKYRNEKASYEKYQNIIK